MFISNKFSNICQSYSLIGQGSSAMRKRCIEEHIKEELQKTQNLLADYEEELYEKDRQIQWLEDIIRRLVVSNTENERTWLHLVIGYFPQNGLVALVERNCALKAKNGFIKESLTMPLVHRNNRTTRGWMYSAIKSEVHES